MTMVMAKTSEPSPPPGMKGSCATPGEPYYYEILEYFKAHTRWLAHYTGAPEEAYAALHTVYENLQPSVRSFLWAYVRKYHTPDETAIIESLKKVVDDQRKRMKRIEDDCHSVSMENIKLRRQLGPVVVRDESYNPHCDLPHPIAATMTDRIYAMAGIK